MKIKLGELALASAFVVAGTLTASAQDDLNAEQADINNTFTQCGSDSIFSEDTITTEGCLHHLTAMTRKVANTYADDIAAAKDITAPVWKDCQISIEGNIDTPSKIAQVIDDNAGCLRAIFKATQKYGVTPSLHRAYSLSLYGTNCATGEQTHCQYLHDFFLGSPSMRLSAN